MSNDLAYVANENAKAVKENALYAAEQAKLGLKKVGSRTTETVSPIINNVKDTGVAVNDSVTTNFKDMGNDLSEITGQAKKDIAEAASKVTLENTKDLANQTYAAVGASASSAYAGISNYFAQKVVEEEVPEDCGESD